jgi:hypothetical protein
MFRTHHLISGVVLLAAGCAASGEAGSTVPTIEHAEPVAPVAPVTTIATPDRAESAVSETTDATPTSEAAAEDATEPAPLRLVVVGDSFAGWSEWPAMYADHISETLAVDVVVDTSVTGTGVPRLGHLKENDAARQAVGAADVLVVQPQAGFAARPMFDELLTGECGSRHEDCFAPHVAAYGEYVGEYFDLLLELAKEGTLVRIVSAATWAPDGFYSTQIRDDPDLRPILIGGVVALMGEAQDAATARGFPFVDVNAAFNGPDYLDVAPDEYLRSDGLHLAEPGSRVVADLLHEVGYDSSSVGS